MKRILFSIFILIPLLWGTANAEKTYGPFSRGNMIPTLTGTNPSGESSYAILGPDAGVVYFNPLTGVSGRPVEGTWSTYSGVSRTRINPVTGLLETVPPYTLRIESKHGMQTARLESANSQYALWNESFDNAVWTKTRSGITLRGTDPAGGENAMFLREDGTAASSHVIQQTFGNAIFADNEILTFSIYAQEDSRDKIRFLVSNKDNINTTAYFDLGTGTVGTTSGGSTYQISETTVNGFYRCSISLMVGSDANDVDFYVSLIKDDNDATYDGDNNSGLSIFGAHISETPWLPSYCKNESGSAVIRAGESGEPKTPILDMMDSGNCLAESLGGELVVNGDMELNSNWNDYSTPADSGQTTAQKHGGSNSWFFVTDGTAGIRSDTFTTVEGTNKFVAWVYPDDGTAVTIRIDEGGGSVAYDASYGGLTQDAWNQITLYYKDAGGISGRVYFYESGSKRFYIDDVSIKQVLNPSPHGGPPSGMARVLWTPGFDDGVAPSGNYGILSSTNVAKNILYLRGDSVTDIRAWDGVNNPQVILNYTAGTTYALYVLWGLKSELPTALQVGLTDNVAYFVVGADSGSGISWGSPTVYDGSFNPATDILLFKDGYGSVHMGEALITTLDTIDVNNLNSIFPSP